MDDITLTLPVAVGTVGCVLTGALLYKKLRPYFLVRVNCWFCNADTKVPYKRKNCFVCPSCKQYNGFNEDGDYNCDMPAQYCESLNSPPSKPLQSQQQSRTESTSGLSLGNGLCQTCNLYQAMKVKALSEFVPSHPDKFDEEVEIYNRRLERLYGGLCRVCTKTLNYALGEQDSWLKPKLIHWRLQQSTLLKALLTPLHNGLSRQQHCISTLLRLLCIVTIFTVAATALVKRVYGEEENTQPQANPTSNKQNISAVTENSEGISVAEHTTVMNSSAIHVLWSEVLQLPSACSVQELSVVFVQHQAGAVMLALTLLLSAIAVAGKRLLKGCDATGCLMLLLLLSLCCWQDSQYISQYFSADDITAAKVLCCAAVCCLLSVGLARRAQILPSPRKNKREPISLDRSQDSQGSNSSFNYSLDNASLRTSTPDGCPSPSIFSTAASTAAPSSSLMSSNGPVFSTSQSTGLFNGQSNGLMNGHVKGSINFQSQSAGLIAGKSGNLANGMIGSVVNGQNGFNVNQFQGGTVSGKVKPGQSSSVGVANNLFGPKVTLKPSVLGESLNTSLGSLQIGTPRKSQSLLNARNAFIQRGNATGTGMVLRAHVSQGSRSNNGIAHASWVAGGYWGSPTKSNRGASTANNNLGVAQNHVYAPAHNIVPNNFPISRSSSQSSGFVSHGSGSQVANEFIPIGVAGGVGGQIIPGGDSDSVTVPSEEAFVWNYEACETSSQCSQNLDDPIHLRRRNMPGSSAVSYASSEARSVVSAASGPSQFSSAASSLLTPQHAWQLQQQQQRRSPLDDLRSMRALSRLSQRDISDDDLSLLGATVLPEVLVKSAADSNFSYRNPWVAFILGMSIMANAFLALVLYKNGIFAELLK
uniref:Transmembrane protein 201-like n=1 Tax=Hirondellea gigas TaxID=1518452 RepID=A0A6A7FX98_9CRUS